QQKGDYEKMAREFRTAVTDSGEEAWWQAMAAAGEATFGHRQAAEAILTELKKKDKRGQQVAHSIAAVEAALGDRDQAFLWLDKAYQQRIGSMVLLQADPQFDPLRQDPRFDELLRRMKMK